MGKVVANGREFQGYTYVTVECGRVGLGNNGRCDGYIHVENPLVVFQNGSANVIHAEESTYIRSGKINVIESKEVVFDHVNDYTVSCKYKKEFLIPDFEALLSKHSGSFTPVFCSGKFNEVHSFVSHPNMCRLSCVIINTRGVVGAVKSGNFNYSRVLPLSKLVCMAAYSATF